MITSTLSSKTVIPFSKAASMLLLMLQDNEKLEAFFSTIPMSFLNPPRLGKKLLVLDLDHTLLDFTRKEVQSHSPQ